MHCWEACRLGERATSRSSDRGVASAEGALTAPPAAVESALASLGLPEAALKLLGTLSALHRRFLNQAQARSGTHMHEGPQKFGLAAASTCM